ncbi:hypothetical protein PIB30_035872 [Stylosanthes scabra]|uniref:Uncharacterized protein n=1 Tax=Stylosanthes scabra TaxID=79078 RepID=A0ABU6SDG4_9FABA|nr:hypothetical protein [Stylosanthes scabra]
MQIHDRRMVQDKAETEDDNVLRRCYIVTRMYSDAAKTRLIWTLVGGRTRWTRTRPKLGCREDCCRSGDGTQKDQLGTEVAGTVVEEIAEGCRIGDDGKRNRTARSEDDGDNRMAQLREGAAVLVSLHVLSLLSFPSLSQVCSDTWLTG